MIEEKLIKKFEKNITLNENLSKYSWFNLGGPAEIFFKPSDEIQIKEFLKEVKEHNKEIFVIGAGSNTLFRDKGLKGLAIKLGSNFSFIKKNGETEIEVGAATLDKKVSNFTKENSITGFEFLSCIPGSIGGAIIMNSGCYGQEISQVLESLKIMDLNGDIKEISKADIEFYYRGTNLPKNVIILSAKFKGRKEINSKIENLQNSFIQKKKKDQPSRVKTCGSTFKNPKGEKAWQLIRKTGSSKFVVGDAQISEQHSNFFVNNGKAKASDIEELINKVKNNVLEKSGVTLSLEIKIIGDK